MPHVPKQRPIVPERVRSPSPNLEDRTQSHLRYYLYTSLFGFYANYSPPPPQSPKHPDSISPFLSVDMDRDQDVECCGLVCCPHVPRGRSTTRPVSSSWQSTQNDGSGSEAEKTSPDNNETASPQTAYGDPSATIWGLYLSQVKQVDKECSESWNDNTNGVLVFSGLFSATVAAFIVVSYQNLQPNPSDTTNRLLSQISQQLSALSNGTTVPGPLILPDKPSFQPTASAVRVNALWVFSLALSTVSAMWATLMQQWTRIYVQAVDRPYPPPKRARIRAFFAEGVKKFGLAVGVELLPGVMHISFLLFYVGLADFFYHINDTVAHCVVALIVLGVLIYLVLTIMPLFYPNSPYQTPLSMVLWSIIGAAPLVKYWLCRQTEDVQKRWRRIREGMRRALESDVKRDRPLDAQGLLSTLNSLDGDLQLEFLSGLPGIFPRSTSQNSRDQGVREMHEAANSAAYQLLATCSTGLLPELARRQRLTACLGAIPQTTKRHCDAIWGPRSETTKPWVEPSTEAWEWATKKTTGSDTDTRTAFRAHCVQAIIAVMWTNGRWNCPTSVASTHLRGQLNASSNVIEEYLARRDNLQLAVAANLLSNALRLLPLLETGPEMSPRTEIKDILDTMCEGLDVSDVPEDLRRRFVNSAQVMTVYAADDMDSPWKKLFSDDTI